VNLGKQQLTILAENFRPDHAYVEKVWLNDRPLDRTWITHGEIQHGGTLRFRMSELPDNFSKPAGK